MKSVLISIRPEWCEKIANGEKTIEVRKTRPKLDTPFKCYIYCTQDKEHTLFKDWIDPPFVTKEYNIMNGKGIKNIFHDNRPWGNANGKVIGEFVCDSVMDFFGDSRFWLDEKAVEQACLTGEQIREYANGKDAYGWNISALQIYEKPRELSEFNRKTGTRERCSGQCETCNHWRYVRVNSEEYDMECEYGGPLFDVLEPITRPPQSWCYVEEQEAPHE